MSIPDQPPRSTDGPSGYPDNMLPEGILPAEYSIRVRVSSDFLKRMEGLCWVLGLNRKRFNSRLFACGVDALTTEALQLNSEDFQEALACLGKLGAKALKVRG